ncbi:unnamed protein product, partial [Tetraodon nigroviridis]
AFAGAEGFVNIVGFGMEKICKRKFGKLYRDEARRLVTLVSPSGNQDAEHNMPLKKSINKTALNNPRNSEAAKDEPRYSEGSLYCRKLSGGAGLP